MCSWSGPTSGTRLPSPLRSRVIFPSSSSRARLTEQSRTFADTALIGVVVVNFGSHHLLSKNISQIDDRTRVVVVDNYLSAQERADIEVLAASRNWHLVRTTENLGFGAGVNLGVTAAFSLGCTSVLLLNPDAVVSADIIADLRSQCARRPLAIVTPRIVTSDGGPYFVGSQVSVRSGHIRRHPDIDLDNAGSELVTLTSGPEWLSWVTGACMAFGKELWQLTGPYDESFFLYWEDVEFSLRAQHKGADLLLRTDLVAVHDEGGTQKRTGVAKSSGYYFYNCRNRLLLARRWPQRRVYLRWLLMTPRESWQILLRGGRRQLVRSPRLLLSAVQGSLAGMLGSVGPS